jgi:uncharacterized protein (TIGR02246 family)
MSKDEQEIRELVATWFAATKSGDTGTVLNLMADDVVFLRPGKPVMHKDNFHEAARKQTGPSGMKIEGSSDIQELCIFDDWAYMWNRITVTVTPSTGARSTTRAGDTLTILRKHNGKWVLFRDANMLVEVPN